MQAPLRLSDLLVIGPCSVHAEAAAVVETSAVTCESWGIRLPTFDDYATMSAHLFPEAPFERLVTITLLNNLLFYFDDVHERHDPLAPSPGALREYLAAFATGRLPPAADVLHGAAVELRERFLSAMPAASFERLVFALERHGRAVASLPADITVDGKIDLDRYLEARIQDSGMEIVIALIEYAGAFTLRDDLRPLVAPLAAACAAIGAFQNDLFSFHKEVPEYGSRFNLVAVLAQDRPLEDAAREAVARVNRYSERFLELEQALPIIADEEGRIAMTRYVAGLRHQTTASWHWQASTPRYRSDASLFRELRGRS
jgi:hypothetical protein